MGEPVWAHVYRSVLFFILKISDIFNINYISIYIISDIRRHLDCVLRSWNSCLPQTCLLVYIVTWYSHRENHLRSISYRVIFPSIPFFRSISDPCSWLVTIDWWSICFCSQRVSCGAATAWWDCFLLVFWSWFVKTHAW